MNSVPIVIDNGSSVIRAGFGGDSEPSVNVPSTGPLVKAPLDKYSSDKKMIPKFGPMFRSPFGCRTIENFDNMQRIWQDIYSDQLKALPEQHPLLISDSPLNSNENREEMLQIFMETFKVPSIYIGNAPTLSLYNAGLTSGIVVDCGESATDIVPIIECFTIQHCIKRIKVAGKQVSDYLKLLLNQQGIVLSSNNEREVLRDIKEQIGFVRGRPSPGDDDEKPFLVPEGQQIMIGRPRYQSAEALFDPSLVGVKSHGIAKMTSEVIETIDEDIRNELSSRILLSGGTTLYSGFIDRFEKGVMITNQTSARPSFYSPANRKNAVWVGGSLLSSSDSFEELSISRSEYSETGTNALYVKTF